MGRLLLQLLLLLSLINETKYVKSFSFLFHLIDVYHKLQQCPTSLDSEFTKYQIRVQNTEKKDEVRGNTKSKETKKSTEFKEPESKESKEPKEFKKTKDYKKSKQSKKFKNPKNPKSPRNSKNRSSLWVRAEV